MSDTNNILRRLDDDARAIFGEDATLWSWREPGGKWRAVLSPRGFDSVTMMHRPNAVGETEDEALRALAKKIGLDVDAASEGGES